MFSPCMIEHQLWRWGRKILLHALTAVLLVMLIGCEKYSQDEKDWLSRHLLKIDQKFEYVDKCRSTLKQAKNKKLATLMALQTKECFKAMQNDISKSEREKARRMLLDEPKRLAAYEGSLDSFDRGSKLLSNLEEGLKKSI